MLSFLNLKSWILNLQASIREFSLKNPMEKIIDLSVKSKLYNWATVYTIIWLNIVVISSNYYFVNNVYPK